MSAYTFTVDIGLRFRDLDTMGHVNNAVYASYLEQARAAYFDDVLDETLADVGSVLAHLEIDYRQPIEYDDGTVTVATRVPSLGESSIPMRYEVRTPEAVAATAETVQVVFDREAERPVSIPVDWSEKISAFEGL